MTEKVNHRSTKSNQKLSKKQVKRADRTHEIMGVVLSGSHKNQVLKKIWLQRKELLHVATVNSEYVMEARSNPEFAQVLTKCITVADGWGVVWASKLLVTSDKSQVERISGTQLVEDILKHASAKGEKVFLLGAGVGVAQRAAANMRKIYPQLLINWYEGAQTVQVEKSEEASMTIAKINAFEPDYLLVAYGSPWQDMWIEENGQYLRARVAMGIGGVLDEWAGVVARCPSWIDRAGFKWLWRLLHEPWRWKRIARVLQFGGLVVWTRITNNYKE